MRYVDAGIGGGVEEVRTGGEACGIDDRSEEVMLRRSRLSSRSVIGGFGCGGRVVP